MLSLIHSIWNSSTPRKMSCTQLVLNRDLLPDWQRWGHRYMALSIRPVMMRLVANPPVLWGDRIAPLHTHYLLRGPIREIVRYASKSTLAARDSILKPQMTHHWPGSPQSSNMSGSQEEGQREQKQRRRAHLRSPLQAIKPLMKLGQRTPPLSTTVFVFSMSSALVWMKPFWALTFPSSWLPPWSLSSFWWHTWLWRDVEDQCHSMGKRCSALVV